MTLTITGPNQVEHLEKFLSWVKSCPYVYTISSMSGGFVHIKFLVSFESASSVTTEKTE